MVSYKAEVTKTLPMEFQNQCYQYEHELINKQLGIKNVISMTGFTGIFILIYVFNEC